MSNSYTYKFTQLAEQDINSVLSYITDELHNPKAAIDLLDKIQNAIDTICTFPLSTADCQIFLIDDKTIRHMLVDNYILIYQIKENEQQIIILRFRYAKMNLQKLLL